MCGRFSLFHNAEEIRHRFKLRKFFREWMKRYNIAPQQQILIVRQEAGENVAEEATWGLIPHWAQEGTKGVINARAESYQEKPTFQDAKRCLIIADGFYEWQKQGKEKQPYQITLKDKGLFAFAGLYDDWHQKRTATIITTNPNELMKLIHDRMPAILQENQEDTWTNPTTDPKTLKNLLTPYPDELLTAIQITHKINNTENEGEETIQPIKQAQTRL